MLYNVYSLIVHFRTMYNFFCKPSAGALSVVMVVIFLLQSFNLNPARASSCFNESENLDILNDKIAEDFLSTNSQNGLVNLQGVGPSSMFSLLNDIIGYHNFLNESVETSYVSVSSSLEAICRIQDYLCECDNPYNTNATNFIEGMDDSNPYFVDFATSEVPIFTSDVETYPDIENYPLAAEAIVPVYNLPGLRDNYTLVLTPMILSKIFRKCDVQSTCELGSITHWNDTLILAENPGSDIQDALNQAGEIEVVVRADESIISEIWKQSLAVFEGSFLTQIGISSSNFIYDANVTKIATDAGIGFYVTKSPSAIGYAKYVNIATYGSALKVPKLNKVTTDICRTPSPAPGPSNNPGQNNKPPKSLCQKKSVSLPISVSANSIEAAILEKAFNIAEINGDVSIALSNNVNSALGEQAWPFVKYSYVIIRKNTLRHGATYQNRFATFQLLESFYTSDGMDNVVLNLGYTVLPPQVKNFILTELRERFMFEGTQVYIPQEQLKTQFRVYTSTIFPEVEDIFENAFENIYQFSNVVHIVGQDPAMDLYMDAEENGLAFYYGNKNIQTGFTSFPLSMVGLGAIFNICPTTGECQYAQLQQQGIVLDKLTLGKILDKSITMWNHPEIVTLQPANVTLPNATIKIVGQRYRDELRNTFQSMIRTTYPAFNISNSIIDYLEETLEGVEARVEVTPFSIAYVPAFSDLAERSINYVNIRRDDGSAVRPSPFTLNQCGLDLEQSNNPQCYPLVEKISILTRTRYVGGAEVCNNGEGSGEMTAKFVSFLYSGILKDSSLDDSVTRLFTLKYLGDLIHQLSDGQRARIKKEIFGITCNGVSILGVNYENNLINKGYLAVGYGVLIFHIAMCIYLYGKVLQHEKGIMMASSPLFLKAAIAGSIIGVFTIVPLSQQDASSENEPVSISENNDIGLNIACQAVPLFFSMGFAVLFSAIWLKSWRMHKLFNRKAFKKMTITNKYLGRVQAIFLLMVLLVNVLWLIYDPLHWERQSLDTSTELILRSTGRCFSEQWYIFVIPLSVMIMCALCYGLWLVYKLWHVPEIFSESKWIAFALLSAFEALVVGVPILFIASEDSNSSYVIKLFLIVSINSLPIFFIMLPKIYMAGSNVGLSELGESLKMGHEARSMAPGRVDSFSVFDTLRVSAGTDAGSDEQDISHLNSMSDANRQTPKNIISKFARDSTL